METVWRAAALALTAVALTACGAEQAPQSQESELQTVTAQSVPVDTAVIDGSAPSVVKVEGTAPACGKVARGTGFVIGPEQVMSMAHVVAGAETVTVTVAETSYDATVVSYDPDLDASILRVPGLQAEKLTLAFGAATDGGDVAMLGYPGGGPFVATPARVTEVIDLQGFDIYGTTPVTRQVIVFEAPVEQGNSGGPVLDADGAVVGMVFGRDPYTHNAGYALPVSELGPMLGQMSSAPVETGACIP